MSLHVPIMEEIYRFKNVIFGEEFCICEKCLGCIQEHSTVELSQHSDTKQKTSTVVT